MLKIHTFHVSGTHCAACKLLIEDVLKEQDMVKNVGVDLKRETVEIETNSDQNPEELARILTEKIKPNGYALSVEKIPRVPLGNSGDDTVWKAVPVGLGFLLVFFMLQKS